MYVLGISGYSHDSSCALLSEGKIVAIPLRAPSIARTIGIVTRRGHSLSPVAESLARMIRTYFDAL